MNDFTGIWVPAQFLALKDTKLLETCLLSHVTMLSRYGECTAKNPVIARQLGVTVTSVSTTLSALKKKGYLHIEEGVDLGNKRKVYPTLLTWTTLFKNFKEGMDSSTEKVFKTLFKSFKEVFKNLNEVFKILNEPVQNFERGYLKVLHSLFQNFKELIYRIENKGESKPENKPQSNSAGGGFNFPSEQLSGQGDKWFLRNRNAEDCNVPFSRWWALYAHDTNKPYCQRLWAELTDEERLTALDHTPRYVNSQPDKSKRKLPENYLSLKTFNDEVIDRSKSPERTSANQKPVKRTSFISADDLCRDSETVGNPAADCGAYAAFELVE